MDIPLLLNAKVNGEGSLEATLVFNGIKITLAKENRIRKKPDLYKTGTIDGKIFFYINKAKESLLSQVVKDGKSWKPIQNWDYSCFKFEEDNGDGCYEVAYIRPQDLIGV